MKKICIYVFVVLTTIMQVNAQVLNDTTVAVQDTITKVVNQQNNHKATVKSTRKTTKHNNNKGNEAEVFSTKIVNDTVVPQQETLTNVKSAQDRKSTKRRNKSGDNNDCKECENQLANAKKENENLQKQVNDLNKTLGNAKAVLDIDDRDFYRSLIMIPLEKKYDSIQVDYYQKTVALFDHGNKKEMKWVYEVFYPLLENYGKYNKDLARLIQRVIKSFELIDVPDSKTEKELFNEGLEETEYFKKYRYKSNISQEIKYLENVINDTKMLFDNPSKFKKESFEEQLWRLEK